MIFFLVFYFDFAPFFFSFIIFFTMNSMVKKLLSDDERYLIYQHELGSTIFCRDLFLGKLYQFEDSNKLRPQQNKINQFCVSQKNNELIYIYNKNMFKKWNLENGKFIGNIFINLNEELDIMTHMFLPKEKKSLIIFHNFKLVILNEEQKCIIDIDFFPRNILLDIKYIRKNQYLLRTDINTYYILEDDKIKEIKEFKNMKLIDVYFGYKCLFETNVWKFLPCKKSPYFIFVWKHLKYNKKLFDMNIMYVIYQYL